VMFCMTEREKGVSETSRREVDGEPAITNKVRMRAPTAFALCLMPFWIS
jgi:hypothetical protein